MWMYGGQEKCIHGLSGQPEGKRLLGMENIDIVQARGLD